MSTVSTATSAADQLSSTFLFVFLESPLFSNLGLCLACGPDVIGSVALGGICSAGVCFMLVFLRAAFREAWPRVRDTEVDLLKEREQIDVSLVSIRHHSRREDRVA